MGRSNGFKERTEAPAARLATIRVAYQCCYCGGRAVVEGSLEPPTGWKQAGPAKRWCCAGCLPVRGGAR